MAIKVYVYSRQELVNSKFEDNNLETYPNDYFICINATGYIDSIPYFKNKNSRVLNLYFDDVEKDQKKYDEEFNLTFYAKACTEKQSSKIKEFIKNIPNNSSLHIHCTKGKSRSPAIAKYVTETRKVSNELSFSNFNKHVYNLLCQI